MTEGKSHINQSNNDEPIKYRRQTSNSFITWNMLWYYNLLFSKCENHNTIITPNHINNLHNITNAATVLAKMFRTENFFFLRNIQSFIRYIKRNSLF